jgi:2-oxoglutarate dehydrogenase E2 component (dihydrolipoamide succinyltransferase)
MATEITVPRLGESVAEATVAKWLKRPGDRVAVDEPVVELETDKATLEVPAPVAGTLTEILAEEGATLAVGAVLCRIGDSGAAAAPSTPTLPLPRAGPAAAQARRRKRSRRGGDRRNRPGRPSQQSGCNRGAGAAPRPHRDPPPP